MSIATDPSTIPHIFLSYKSEELHYATRLRNVLVALGFTVWWDRNIQTGREWNAEIDKALSEAKCIIVLWSNRSIESKWVANEAAHAMTRLVYVPVRIENVDIPAPFNRQQAATLIGWDGKATTSDFPSLLNLVSSLLGVCPNDQILLESQPPWPPKVLRPRLAQLAAFAARNWFAICAIAVAATTTIAVFYALDAELAELQLQKDSLKTLVESVKDSEEKTTAAFDQQQVFLAKQGDELKQQSREIQRSSVILESNILDLRSSLERLRVTPGQ